MYQVFAIFIVAVYNYCFQMCTFIKSILIGHLPISQHGFDSKMFCCFKKAARQAGQEDAAKFMEKVMQACAKYYVPPSLPELPVLPNLPGGMPVAPVPLDMLSQSSGSGQPLGAGSIIIPGSPIRKGRPPSGSSGSGIIIPGR